MTSIRNGTHKPTELIASIYIEGEDAFVEAIETLDLIACPEDAWETDPADPMRIAAEKVWAACGREVNYVAGSDDNIITFYTNNWSAFDIIESRIHTAIVIEAMGLSTS